jgi:two-component system OmpR family sensor kinase
VRSIRGKLILWVVGAMVLGVIIVLSVTYVRVRAQVGNLFDEELRQVALAVHLREDWQDRRLRIARPGFFLSVRAYDEKGAVFFETLQPSLPADLKPTFDEGLSYGESSEGRWRVYTHVTEEGIVQVGQAIGSREQLARDLSLKALLPMLLMIPFLSVFIAWALHRGLAPLQETSARVSDRDASRLDPLPVTNVPRELVPLVEQINGLLRRLEDSLGAQRRFLADAAHELRSPVGALALQVQLAARAHTEEARAKAFEELGRGIERARRLVQQLLDFAKLESSVRSEPFVLKDLAELVREVVGSSSARAESIGVDLGADAPAAAPILCSPDEMRSLVENLVDNALRYAPPSSQVTVSVRLAEESIELTVSDLGPGIPVDERQRVFERFHRVAGDSTAGSGLGLAIAKAIVDRHGASMDLEDAAPGHTPAGLLVRVRLPARSADRVSADAPHPH